jgi:hypothetical protein
MWPELVGRQDWIGKAITIARDNGASSPAYALKVLANSLHTGNEPGYKPPTKNGTDPDKRTAGVVVTPERQAEIDRRQAEYEQQTALELVRLGMLS